MIADRELELCRLHRQLDETLCMERNSARMRVVMATVLARLKRGHWVVNNGGRCWWCDDSGPIEQPSADEMSCVYQLSAKGIV